MAKELTEEEIYIAPKIRGKLDENNTAIVFDEKDNVYLDPKNIEDKIKIYERQVKGWFLERAEDMTKQNNAGFTILMICLSYIEGVEQYREGSDSKNKSTSTFINGVLRMYPKINERSARSLYSQARCGLFHDGMVRRRILIKDEFPQAISFVKDKIHISPIKLFNDVKADFQSYLQSLKEEGTLQDNFDKMFTNVPKSL